MGYQDELQEQWDRAWEDFDNSMDFDPTNYLHRTPVPSRPSPRFDTAVTEILGKALAVCKQRGGEYADSWGDANLQTQFMNAVDRYHPESDLVGRRMRMLAALCDVKMSRLLGGYKADTFEDLINYLAALAWELQEDNK